MRNKILPVLSIVFLAIAAYPQTDNSKEINTIRDEYTKVKLEIEKIEKDEDAAFQSYLAVNELVINKLNKSWPAVGNYTETYRFYYKQAGEEPYPDHLVFVTRTTVSAARKYYKEYLFDDSKKLVFIFVKDYEEGEERRGYFKSGELIEYSGEAEKFSTLPSSFATAALEKAAKLQSLFTLSIE